MRWRLLRSGLAAISGGTLILAEAALACSCIAPADRVTAGRAALAAADLVAVLAIEQPPPALPRAWCRADGRAWPWFRSGRTVERFRAARVIRLIKGEEAEPIRIRDHPLESSGGQCVIRFSSCDVSLDIRPDAAQPMLFRRVASATFEPLDFCSQAAFQQWYAAGGRVPSRDRRG